MHCLLTLLVASALFFSSPNHAEELPPSQITQSEAEQQRQAIISELKKYSNGEKMNLYVSFSETCQYCWKFMEEIGNRYLESTFQEVLPITVVNISRGEELPVREQAIMQGYWEQQNMEGSFTLRSLPTPTFLLFSGVDLDPTRHDDETDIIHDMILGYGGRESFALLIQSLIYSYSLDLKLYELLKKETTE